MTGSALWATFRKELRRLRRDPLLFASTLGIPIVLAVLLAVLFGQSAPTPRGRLLVADQDGSFAAALLAGAFQRAPLDQMIATEKVDRTEGLERLARGRASALLTIPKGFGAALLDRRPVALDLVTNPSERILPGIIREVLATMCEAGHYAQSILGTNLDLFRGRTPTEPEVGATSTAMYRTMRDVARFVDPPVIELVTETRRVRPVYTLSFAAMMFPGMLVMALMMLAQGLSADLWKERASGTLRRALCGPGGASTLLAGKLLAVIAVLLVAVPAGLLLAAWLTDLPMRHLPLGVAWATWAGAAFYLGLVFVQTHAATERAAHLLASMLVLPLAMLGGSLLPFEMMPAGLGRWGRWTPNGWVLAHLRAILEGTAQPGTVLTGIAVMTGAMALLFWLNVRRARGGFAL